MNIEIKNIHVIQSLVEHHCEKVISISGKPDFSVWIFMFLPIICLGKKDNDDKTSSETGIKESKLIFSYYLNIQLLSLK